MPEGHDTTGAYQDVLESRNGQLLAIRHQELAQFLDHGDGFVPVNRDTSRDHLVQGDQARSGMTGWRLGLRSKVIEEIGVDDHIKPHRNQTFVWLGQDADACVIPGNGLFATRVREHDLLPCRAMTTVPARARRLSDWIGFIVFFVWACVTFSKMPAVGIFVAPTLIFELCVALSFLVRDQPLAANRSTRARLSAYGGSFFILAFLQVANRYYPEWFVPTMNTSTFIGTGLWVVGTLWTAYAVWHMRYAFSIEPAARRLITSGPYKVARHPVYTGYFAQYAGMLLTFPSVAFGLAIFVWSLLMADRMRHEELVLSEAFPEYDAYRRRVGALWSVPSRRVPRPEPAAQAQ